MTAVLLLLRKDLRVLRRSPVILGALLAYPIVIALLVGLVAGYASAKPRVAFVDEDHLPNVVAVGGHRFHIQTVIDDVAKQVTLVRLSPREAARQLADGKVVATITVPPGFLGDLQTTVRSPSLILQTGSGGLSPRVTEQVQALVYQLNGKLQVGYISANLVFVRLLLHGGEGSFLGRHFNVLGLERTQAELAKLPQNKRVDAIAHFVRVARAGLAQTGAALKATANPITLRQAKTHGRTWLLSAQVQSYGIALTVTFLALLLAAGAAAAEHDEGTIGRLRRGLVSLSELVWAKIALAAVVGLALGGAIAIVFGIVVESGGITGGEPWSRLPLLLAGVVLAAAVVGAAGTLLGALAREARTASLLAVLVVLPVVFLGLVPRGALGLAYWVSLFLPFAHAYRLFDAALYSTHPWHTVAVEGAWLLGLGLAFGGLARRAVRTLSA
ncbi:MAG TPA: ABC transporter permease [Gaiellaceae bacterium]|nr:ABC transporter permease [Gaiellaceae bacterium]